MPPTLVWCGGERGHLEVLDQTRLPHERRVLRLRSAGDVVEAIRSLVVRGAPAIGVAAAYGLVLGLQSQVEEGAFVERARLVAARLAAARPTAVNLQWALDRCLAAVDREPCLAAVWREACAVHADDVAASRRIAAHGAPLVRDGATVLTHCNTGRLATAGEGTALGILFAAWRAGRRFRVLADETRPLLQGARLTALELGAAGIPVQVVVDAAAPGLIARGAVDLVLVGADRIARNGDFANKVGTYGLALASAAHGVPFHVAAPASTFDLTLAEGRSIPIEERDADEVLQLAGQSVAAPGIPARNPAFDVTPGRLVASFVTDRGVLTAPFDVAFKTALGSGR
ncbi:MAG: S-methyl-5-thioribose-1-phosphate isomerase [Planctomycetes bacterium]|nr:S-methyl-5-thioribose-1-phosphate isomerase [Planctomycetota bacterium]